MTQELPLTFTSLLADCDPKERGGAFLFALRCRGFGIEIDAEVRSAMEQRFQLRRTTVDDVKRFIDAFLQSPEAGLSVCHGSSCHLNGSPRFLRRIEEILAESNLKVELRPFHCLSNCLDGPNVAVGPLLFSALNGKVEVVPDRQIEMRKPV